LHSFLRDIKSVLFGPIDVGEVIALSAANVENWALDTSQGIAERFGDTRIPPCIEKASPCSK
jgi:hypothetical protein